MKIVGASDYGYNPIQTSQQTNSRTDSANDAGREAFQVLNQHVQGIENTQAVEERSVDEHEVIKAIEKANKHIRSFDRRLEFSIHDSTKQIMVKVIDTDSGDVIREIPSEKILDMVAHLWQISGILIDEKR